MNKIKYVSMCFRIIFQIIFLILILAQIIGWIYAPINISLFNIIPPGYQIYLQHSLSVSDKIAGFAITIIPTAIKLITCYCLIQLLYLYERFEFFSEKNVRHIQHAGYSLLLFQLLNPLSEFVLGFILTANNPPGFRFARMSLTEMNIGLIFTALIIILVSWIMAEGVKLRNEHQLTV